MNNNFWSAIFSGRIEAVIIQWNQFIKEFGKDNPLRMALFIVPFYFGHVDVLEFIIGKFNCGVLSPLTDVKEYDMDTFPVYSLKEFTEKIPKLLNQCKDFDPSYTILADSFNSIKLKTQEEMKYMLEMITAITEGSIRKHMMEIILGESIIYMMRSNRDWSGLGTEYHAVDNPRSASKSLKKFNLYLAGQGSRTYNQITEDFEKLMNSFGYDVAIDFDEFHKLTFLAQLDKLYFVQKYEEIFDLDYILNKEFNHNVREDVLFNDATFAYLLLKYGVNKVLETSKSIDDVLTVLTEDNKIPYITIQVLSDMRCLYEHESLLVKLIHKVVTCSLNRLIKRSFGRESALLYLELQRHDLPIIMLVSEEDEMKSVLTFIDIMEGKGAGYEERRNII